MPTDTERREVARRLRQAWANVPDANPIRHHLRVLCAIYEAVGFSDVESDAIDLFDRLADLIEPSEPKVRCVAEVKVDGERLERLTHDAAVELTGIDREALLEEVKELEKCAWYFGLDFDTDEPLRDRLKEAAEDFAGCAARIREALGANDG